MRKNAFESPGREEYVDGKGRRALTSYLEYGYIPLEDSVWDAFHKNEQVSRTLEYSLDDYALSRFAKALNKTSDYEQLMARAGNWKNVFDTKTGFVRGRYADGSWITPFDPYSKAKFICEGTPYHYTWYVPHDVPGLIRLMGGKKPFIARMNTFFDDGHYWHGNEPGHQVPFMFAMAGAPEKTQKWVQKIVTEEYGIGPGGLSGNEDAGQMSAWLVFAMMGFYPVCPASGSYIMSVPMFDEVKIKVGENKEFILNTENRKPGINITESVIKDGRTYKTWQFSHNDVVNGSRFLFRLKQAE
jgi:predicted alpha-1,2-mannosidase